MEATPSIHLVRPYDEAESIPAMPDVARANPEAQLLVRVLEFNTGVLSALL